MIQRVQEHLEHPRAAQAGAVHVRAPRGVPHRRPHPDAWNRRRRADPAVRAEPGFDPRLRRPVLRRELPPAHDLRPGHHAVHHGIDHPAAPDRDLAVPGEAEQGGRGRAQEDHAVDALRDGPAVVRAVLRHRAVAAEQQRERRGPDRAAPGLRVPAHDRADLDHRDRVHHVARRADLGARHRQRHLADHLRRDRRRPSRSRGQHVAGPVDGPAEPDRRAAAPRRDGRRGRGDRAGRARAAQDPDPVRAPRRRTPGLRRRVDVPAAARQHRGRDPGDLRLVDAGDPADDRHDRNAAGRGLDPGPTAADVLRRAAVQPAVLGADHLLLLLLRVDHLQPDGSGRQHEEVRRVHPGDPPGQAHRRVHRPHPDAPDLRRCGVPGIGQPAPGVPDLRGACADAAMDRRDAGPGAARVLDRGARA